ncbi:MAG: amino acid adenylation domain-containing protein, partial [Chloroflexi bacterium]|nr:amino acid adenylation domain-containing protein [Chloroflexota bacterium]
ASPAYNVPYALRLTGELNESALQRSLQEIVARHEVLRTTFGTDESGQPVQVIAPELLLPLPTIDLQDQPATNREAVAQERLIAEIRRPFDLQHGPLLRAVLLRLDRETALLVLTLHHIVADAWSLNVFMRELSALYAAALRGTPHEHGLATLPIQYADYALWQRDTLQGAALDKELAYWRTRLADVPTLALPTDHQRPPVPSFRGARQPFVLSPALSDQLQTLSREAGATLFMTLLAAWQVLLSRMSGQDDLVVGTPVANRTRAEVEPLIGFFINMLPIRADLTGATSFRDVLARVRETALEAFAHQDVPFERVVEAVQAGRDLSRHPIFQVMFVLQNATMAPPSLPGLDVEVLPIEFDTVKFDLILAMEETAAGLTGVIGCSRDLFDESTISRLVGYFQTLLAGIVAAPDQPLHTLPLLTAVETEQLRTGNASTTSFPSEPCVPQLIEQQAARTPDAVALRFEDQTLRYAELDARANQLAQHLLSLGVAPETRVGLYVERSLDLVVGLLGIWKAGGASVPIDPSYPAERIQFMLGDSAAMVLVTQNTLLGSLPEHAAQVVCLDVDAATLAQGSTANPPVRITPANLAYLIYTSGTTGRPKAVQVEHRQLLNVLHASQQTFGYQASDVQPWIASIAFDIALFELLNPLLAGGTTEIVAQRQALDGARLLDGIAEWTQLHAVPSLLRQIVQTVTAAQAQGTVASRLRRIFVGGDAVPPELLADAQAAFPEAELVVLYGPTEGTIICTRYVVPRDRRPVRQLIGQPLPNMQVRVYDPHGQLAPIGVAGELYLGGAGVTRGYLNRPELTAEKFVELDGQRWYRTGDRVRYLPDGTLEFLGRTDAQVKIRGYRIEVGEVEAVLAQHEAVVATVVMAREDVPGDRRLVAYVVPDAVQPPTVTELRRFLGTALPEYMVPGAFVFLGALPLTPNGKVDRKALPAPDQARPDLEKAFVAPRTPLEELLAGLWQDVLGLQAVGVHDNFFELGGNSIQAAILINKLQAALGEVVYVVAVFDAPTIADLAAYLLTHTPQAAARILGVDAPAQVTTEAEVTPEPTVDAALLAEMREVVTPLPPRAAHLARPKNPRAIFLLSPPRSGSTLLRVMLAGHPQLFAPPELELLSFNTLDDRKIAFTGRDRFWLEGTVRAIMAIRGCDAPTAERIMAECEAQGQTVQEFYALMQSWLGARTLVDKTPSYALDLKILQRMEEDFEQPLYIHLLRHPYGMIRSFEDARLDQVFFRHDHSFPTRTLAELIWTVCQQNIQSFLTEIPAERQHQLRFEDLTAQPEHVLEDLCRFLGLPYRPEMAQPYQDKQQRMTDGIHAMSKMVGDVKFHQHTSVDARISERWKEHYTRDFLGDPTWQLAESLGYRRPAPEQPASSALTPIPVLPRDGSVALPLSFAQQRLWFIDQLQPDGIAYNVPLAFRLTGALDPAALARALNTIVSRHEALRTAFPTEAGQPCVVIAPSLHVPLPLIDLQSYPAAQRESIAQLRITAEARTPFDLQHGPLIRTMLLRLDEQAHVLVVNLHHIIADGWSMSVFMRELTALYDAALRGAPDDHGLPELPIQYTDYAGWQQAWLRNAAIVGQLESWKQQLADVPVLQLPTDRPRPALPSHAGGSQLFSVPAAVSQELQALSRREGVTLFMTLLAAWQVLLSRYSTQTDLAVGIPSAGRTRPELDGLIGYFVNTQVVRTDLSGAPPFREVLARVRAGVLHAFSNQDVPFEQVVDAVQPVRDLSHHPLFQVMFALQNAPMAPLQLPNVTVQALPVAYGTAKFDLSLDLWETAEGLAGALEYATDLFDAATIGRLVGHFQTLLAAIATGPEQRISALPLLTATEQQQVVQTWNPASTAYPHTRTVHELVTQQAARRPDAIAVIVGGEQCTYAELNTRANQLAHQLQSLGIGVGTPVGICLERSLAFVVGVLAILKAGGAYVPLDPSYPAERVQFMLHDTAAPVIITTAELAATLPEHAAQLVCVDRDATELAARPTSEPISDVTAEHLAYLIYTSGSTGQPKGIGIPHRAITRLVCDTNYVQLTPEDGIGLMSNISFDAATFELWGALIHGARLIGVPREVALAPQALAAHIRQYGIDTMFVTTALFNQIAREVPDAFATMRDLLVGGDALDAHAIATVLAAGAPRRLLNGYGPTESTTFASWFEITEVPAGATTIPIGYPLANTQLYILDDQARPVPVGVPGELYIGGDGLAHGYLNQPALTAEKFIPDPFGAVPGARLYRTGDIVRYLPDGAIAFVGRRDHQVKLRGFRIELGEIEAALGQHPAVGEAVVLVREDLPGVKRLVAYVVEQKNKETKEQRSTADSPSPAAAGEGDGGGEGLRSFLQARLPEYMVPSAFVLLDALPLTPNGKLDRKALPAPEIRSDAAEDMDGEPLTGAEATLAGIWAAVLGVERVGRHDNFFALGGDSILSIQVIARANQAGLRLSPTQLFQNQTIALLAAVADTRPAVVAEQGLLTGAAPLTPIQHWLLARELPELHHFNQSVVLEPTEPLDAALLTQAIQHVLLHHDALRLRFHQTEAGWYQEYASPAEQPLLSTFDLGALSDDVRQAAFMEHANALQASLSLEFGPLLRAALFEFGGVQRLVVVVHHLAVDWVSWAILVDDLDTAYRQLAQGGAVVLPAKTTAFGQWAERLSAAAQTDAVLVELPYWEQVTQPALPALPVDHPEGANTVALVQHHTVTLSAAETTALLQAAPQAYRAQPQDLLLTALVETLGEWSGERRVRLDLEGHGRDERFADVDLTRTVGWFTALYPVLLDLRAHVEPGAALKAVKEQLRAVPSQGLGYGLLRYLAPDERAQVLRAGQPAEVGFNYLGQLTQGAGTAGLFRRLDTEAGADVSARTARPHRLAVTALVVDGVLTVRWSASAAQYAAPTIAALAEQYLGALRELIAHCLRPAAGGWTPSDVPLARLDQATVDRIVAGTPDVADMYALTALQQGMLFHSLADAGSGVYVEQLVSTLRGPLDVAAFQAAWDQVVARHAVLRTSFVWAGLAEPLQVVHIEAIVPWQIEDWRTCSIDEQNLRLAAFVEADRRQGIDPAQAPLMRLALFQVADDIHRFVWTQHHLLLDGWSLPLVLTEVFTSYEARVSGRAIQHTAPRPYRDYIAWLQKQDLAQAEAF